MFQTSMNFDQENSEYTAHRPLYDRSSRLYDGGKRVEQGGYLIQHAWEPDKQFGIRRQRAVYSNFAAPIVDVFGASICEKRPAATLPERLESMAANVDRQGKGRDAFFQNVVTLAAGHGIRFVLVDHPSAESGGAGGSMGKSAGPYFVQIDAQNVIDWQIGTDGGLEWAVIKEVVEARRQPFEASAEITRHTLWTRTTWERFEDAVSVGGGEHGLGVVPLVPFAFEQTGPMTGLSVIDEVATLLLSIFRRESELDKLLFDSAVPLLHMAGITQEQAVAFVKASWNALTTEPDARIQYVETSGGSFNALTQKIDRDIARVREIALRTIRPASGVGESAESKKLDNRQLDCQLAKFARQCKAAEEQCWKIAAKWLKMDVADKDIECPYNEKFDAAGIDLELTNLLLALRKDGDISRAAVLEHPEIRKALPKDFDPVEDAAELEKEAQAGPGPSGAGATGLEALGRRLAEQAANPANPQNQGAGR